MARSVLPLLGARFGRLTVVRYVGMSRLGKSRWVARCDCGMEREVIGANLTSGMTRSCGCSRADAKRTHGFTNTPTYRSWAAARNRCENPAYAKFHGYGGRGISMCKRWRSFENFLADMGERPAGTTLDRIDVNGNYEPGNCRWASAAVQANNKRRHAALEAV